MDTIYHATSQELKDTINVLEKNKSIVATFPNMSEYRKKRVLNLIDLVIFTFKQEILPKKINRHRHSLL